MKALSTDSNSITISLQSHELSILRAAISLYRLGAGTASVTFECRPPHLAYVDLDSLDARLDALCKLHATPPSSADVDQLLDPETEHATTLRTDDWAMCLHVLTILVYGCVVGDDELYLSRGLEWSEFRAVMESLHKEIEKQVLSLASQYKSSLRSRTYRIVDAELRGEPGDQTAHLQCRLQPRSWDGELIINKDGYRLRSRVHRGHALRKNLVSLRVERDEYGKYQLVSQISLGKYPTPRRDITCLIETEELAQQIADFLGTLQLGQDPRESLNSSS